MSKNSRRGFWMSTLMNPKSRKVGVVAAIRLNNFKERSLKNLRIAIGQTKMHSSLYTIAIFRAKF